MPSGSIKQLIKDIKNKLTESEKLADQIVKNANKEANEILFKARLEAKDIIENANKKAKKIIEDARKESSAIKTKAKKDVIFEKMFIRNLMPILFSKLEKNFLKMLEDIKLESIDVTSRKIINEAERTAHDIIKKARSYAIKYCDNPHIAKRELDEFRLKIDNLTFEVKDNQKHTNCKCCKDIILSSLSNITGGYCKECFEELFFGIISRSYEPPSKIGGLGLPPGIEEDDPVWHNIVRALEDLDNEDK